MSFFVDPPGLLLLGATVCIVFNRLNAPKSMNYALSGGLIVSFTFGGIGLYLDWFRWVILGVVDLKGSYVMLEQGLTGLSKATFPAWIVILFLSLYPFWFTLGYETARRRNLGMRFVPIFIIGVLLLLIPSIVESRFLAS